MPGRGGCRPQAPSPCRRSGQAGIVSAPAGRSRPPSRKRGYRRPGLAPGEEKLAFALDPQLRFPIEPVGVVRSPYQWREEAPRQANTGAAVTAVVVLRPGLQNTLHCLHGFDYCWLLTWLHRSYGWREQLVPPRDRVKRGVFATRSPDRPNPIGLSAVRLLAVVGCRLRVRGVDLLDGTPVLDIKPYIPAYDAFPLAAAGWVDELTDPDCPDHRTPQACGLRMAARRSASRSSRPSAWRSDSWS